MPHQFTEHLVFDRIASRAVDAKAIERYGIPGVVLMENAARGSAEIALDMLAESGTEAGPVTIICGGGNNGGDGYAIARHLHNAGVKIAIVAVGEPRDGSDAAINAEICRRMHLPTGSAGDLHLDHAALVIDAIFGTGLDRPVEGEAAAVIEAVNAAHRSVLAIDIPSGLDCDTGDVLGVAVRATRTASFLGVKKGFLTESGRQYAGAIHVVHIGAPRELIEACGRSMPSEDQRR